MAAPNITSHTTSNGKSFSGALTTSAATMLNNAASSGKVLRVMSLYVSNIDGTNAADLTVNYYTQDDIGGTAYAICKTVSVPADSTICVIDNESPIFLEEDKSIGGLASANSDLEYVGSYLDVS